MHYIFVPTYIVSLTKAMVRDVLAQKGHGLLCVANDRGWCAAVAKFKHQW